MNLSPCRTDLTLSLPTSSRRRFPTSNSLTVARPETTDSHGARKLHLLRPDGVWSNRRTLVCSARAVQNQLHRLGGLVPMREVSTCLEPVRVGSGKRAVAVESPRLGGELREQHSAPTRVSGENRTRGLDSTDERKGGPHAGTEDGRLPVALQNPPGSNDTVVPAWPRRAISRTMRAPMELPTMSMLSRPSDVRNCSTASVSVAMVPSPLSGAVSPKPGRSTAITSRSKARAATTGSQLRRLEPSPWTKSRGAFQALSFEVH